MPLTQLPDNVGSNLISHIKLDQMYKMDDARDFRNNMPGMYFKDSALSLIKRGSSKIHLVKKGYGEERKRKDETQEAFERRKKKERNRKKKNKKGKGKK